MAIARVGIRREDKNDWERRVPLVPDDIRTLTRVDGLELTVQPSSVRVFADDQFRDAGAQVSEDLSGCGLVLAVKEIPADLLHGGAAYAFFSHTMKGQEHNMPLLQRVLDTGCTLLDYERVVDADGRRLIHFGRFAGIAGTLDALWALGRRFAEAGIDTPFLQLRPAWGYADLAAAYRAVDAVGARIAAGGLDPAVGPLVFGITGYGNVGSGVREVLDHLPVSDITPSELPAATQAGASAHQVLRVEFREPDTVERASGGAVDVAEYRSHPERYRSTFARHLPYLSVLMNSIYWDQRGPRLVSREDLAALGPGSRLRLIADLSCDIDGGIASTVRATTPDAPTYVYDPATGHAVDGMEADGIVVLAVDNLPCEVPRDASAGFSAALRPFVPALAGCDFTASYDHLDLPAPWRPAVIAHRGRLAPPYAYLQEALDRSG